MGRPFEIANAVMLLAFAFSAVVQFNDPDPLRWVLMYGAAALACTLTFLRRERWWSVAPVGVISLLWALALVPGVVGRVPFMQMFSAWEMQNAGIEESRELYGLLIVTAWLAVLAVRAWRRGRAHVQEEGAGDPGAIELE